MYNSNIKIDAKKIHEVYTKERSTFRINVDRADSFFKYGERSHPMAIIETKNTLAAINQIKKELSKFLKIISYVSMAIFSVYYAYLIYANLAFTIHLVVFSILFVTVLVSFLFEVALRAKNTDERMNGRIKIERKRLIGMVTKSFKYIAKVITIVLALQATLSHLGSDVSLIMNVVSCITLAFQLTADFVIYFVNRYIDYLSTAVELDFKSSSLSKVVLRKQYQLKALESKKASMTGKSIYTKKEQKRIGKIEETAERLNKERNKQLDLKISSLQSEIKEYTKGLSKRK